MRAYFITRTTYAILACPMGLKIFFQSLNLVFAYMRRLDVWAACLRLCSCSQYVVTSLKMDCEGSENGSMEEDGWSVPWFSQFHPRNFWIVH